MDQSTLQHACAIEHCSRCCAALCCAALAAADLHACCISSHLQKDSVLEELERLTEGLVAQARASHDPAFDLRCCPPHCALLGCTHAAPWEAA